MENKKFLIEKAGKPINEEEVDFGMTAHIAATLKKELDNYINTKQLTGEILDILLDLKNILKEIEDVNTNRFKAEENLSKKKLEELSSSWEIALNRLSELDPSIHFEVFNLGDDDQDDLKLKFNQLN